jgi:hypothetical protein
MKNTPSTLATIISIIVVCLAISGYTKAAVFTAVAGVIIILGIIGDLLTDLVTTLVYDKKQK